MVLRGKIRIRLQKRTIYSAHCHDVKDRMPVSHAAHIDQDQLAIVIHHHVSGMQIPVDHGIRIRNAVDQPDKALCLFLIVILSQREDRIPVSLL